jgi:uncharacterized protein (TIGR02996 family)
VASCTRCGKDNDDAINFCAACAADLSAQRSPVTTRSPGEAVIMRNPPMPVSRDHLAPPLSPTPWRAVLSDDPAEHGFLVPLRARPGDEGVRMVYADWLEQRGEVDGAQFVRHEGLVTQAVGDPSWRSIVSRGNIARCHQEGEACPKRWDKLEARADDERGRTCATCHEVVRYCVDGDAALRCGLHHRCPITLDAQVDARAGRNAFDRGLALAARNRPG